jgi:hypothetical protein
MNQPNSHILYRLAAWSAIAILGIIVVQFVTFMAAPPPYEGTAANWFEFFQTNPTAGLIDFELLMVVYVVISLVIDTALFLALRRTHPSAMLLYLVVTIVGIVAFISARPALEMLRLSRAYMAASDPLQRSIYLSAGESLIAIFNGTAFQVSYLLGSIGGLILSAVLLQSPVFNKWTAYLRIASSLCDLGLYLPGIGLYISMFSVFFLFAWHILITIQFFRLGRKTEPAMGELVTA